MVTATHLTRPIQRLISRHVYLWSITIAAAITFGLWAIQKTLSLPGLSITPIYLIGVLLCAVTAGRVPALICATLSFFTFKFFFVEPLYSFTADDAEDVTRMLIFMLTALLGGGIGVWVREQADATQERADETAALYELSQAISTQLDFNAIAPVIVATTRRLIECPGCQLLLATSGGLPVAVAFSGGWPPGASTAEAPLRSGGRLLGSLRVALAPPRARLAKKRQLLLETLASQAALALERSRLAQAAARAEALGASDRLKSTLLSAVSHDFRTPLASIIAAADELLADDVAWSPAAIADFSGVIHDEAQRLNHMVTNLLDLTRIEAGVLRPQLGWYNPAEIIYNVLRRLGADLSDRPVDLLVPDDLPLVPVDYVQLEQVLWNILENALKYSPAGSPISLSAAAEESVLAISIGDRGRGIAAEDRTRVFETFYRSPTLGHDRIPGSGIGLAICKGLVDAHGGTVAVLERDGGGTLVEVRLPLHEHALLVSAGE